MNKCTNCGADLSPSAKFCTACGNALNPGTQNIEFDSPAEEPPFVSAPPPTFQNPPPSPVYYQPRAQAQETRVVPVKEWLLLMLINCIPVVGVIMMFVWAFGGDTAPSKANYCKAALIMWAIGIGVTIVIYGLFLVVGVVLWSSVGESGLSNILNMG